MWPFDRTSAEGKYENTFLASKLKVTFWFLMRREGTTV